MLKRTHLMFAVFLYVVLIYYNIISFNLINFGIVLLSAIIPDIDIQTSKLGQKFKILSESFKHRGFFHSVLFFILTHIILLYSHSEKHHYFLIGYLSHLFLDSLNYKSIYWFWPIKFKWKGFCKTEGFTEQLIFYFSLSASIYLGFVIFL